MICFIKFEINNIYKGMERRILISGVILTVSIVIIIGIFFIHSHSKDRSNPIKSIPQDAAIILRLNGFNLMTTLIEEKTKVWSDLLPIQSVDEINTEIKTIDSLFKKIPHLHESINESDIYISGHLSGSKKIYFLSIMPLPEEINKKDLLRILSEDSQISFSERKYEGKQIFNIITSQERNIHISIENGLLLFSTSPVLIEDAIRQTTLPNSLLDNSFFANMFKATGKNKDANLFIDLKQAGKIFTLYANNTLSNQTRNYTKLGNWAEFDINIKEDIILLNGFSQSEDTSTTFIKTISTQEPVKITIPEVLPSNTSGYIAYGISSPMEYYQNYLTYLGETGKLTTYRANLDNMNSKYGVEFDSFFLNLIDNQLALAYRNDPSADKGTEYFVIKCKSGNDTRNALEELTQKLKTKTNGKLKYTYSPDKEVNFTIYRIPIYPLFGRLIGDFFKGSQDNYLVVVDNYLVVTGTFNEASQLLYDYMLKHTLEHNDIYREFANNLSMKSYLLLFNKNFNNTQFFERYLNDETLEQLKKNKVAFQKAQTTGLQISEVSNLPYFNLFLKHHDDFRGRPHTVWESRLDTSVSMKPKFVINHYTQQNDIVIQDDRNNLYLLNQAGRIIWKIALEEKINSDIHQIDYYKNGKLQLLFSTKSSLHLIDRNGNYVERYPVRLRSESTAGLSVFDYESNKNYRIFVPCRNKKVYAYSKEGNVINGWKFKQTDYTVTQSVKHFRIIDNDYIIFGDKTSTYILDRKGNQRVKPEKSFSKSINNTYYQYDSGNLEDSYFVTTDTSGKIYKIFTSGRIKTQEVGKFSNQHFFDFKDVNADGKSDYIFLDNNELTIFSDNGNKIFDKTFKENISQHPVYYHFSYTDRKIGIVTEKNEIYLINNNGDTYKGFPVEGKTQFTIGYFDLTTSRFNLIVGGRNNFLYNYAVE